MEHTAQNMAVKLQNGEDPMQLIMKGENVYTVNAVMRALASNDYNRLAKENDTLKFKLACLERAIYEYGLYIDSDDDGEVVLRKRE
jgi:hypothetical protein